MRIVAHLQQFVVSEGCKTAIPGVIHCARQRGIAATKDRFSPRRVADPRYPADGGTSLPRLSTNTEKNGVIEPQGHLPACAPVGMENAILQMISEDGGMNDQLDVFLQEPQELIPEETERNSGGRK